MNVEELLRAAETAVDGAGVADDLRPVAFQRALDILGGDLLPREAGANGGSNHSGRQPDRGGTGSALARMAQKFGVREERLLDIYEVRDSGELALVVPDRALDGQKSAGAKQIALLLVAGRAAAGVDEYTSTALIREQCEHYGRLDSGNFAKSMEQLDDIMKSRGNSRNRQLAMRAGGWDKAKELIAALSKG